MRYILDPKIIKQIIELKKTGLNNTAIAKKIGCDRGSVWKYVTLYKDQINIDLKTTPEKITELWNKGYTPGQIAAELNLSGSCVRSNIVKLGLRPKREYHKKMDDVIDVKMPPLKVKPETDIFYPDRTYEVKRYQDKGKKYFDVSEVYGL